MGNNKITTTTYENRHQNGAWLLGLPTETTVTSTALGKPDLTNKTSATYTAQGYPHTETLEEGHAQQIITTYDYDQFGNVTSVDIASGGETRSSTTTYTPDGRFPVGSTNALGHTNQVVIDSRWGKPLRVTNANDLVKVTEYDEFGTVINEDTQWDNSPQRQAREHAKPYWCDTNPSCPNEAVYLVGALDDQGESPQAVYYDAYGRELLKQTVGADLDGNATANGSAIYIKTVYDTLGRKTQTSRPGTNLFDLTYDEVKFDAHGRVSKRITVDGVTTLIYDKLTTTTTNPKLQSTSVTTDLRGKPTKSEDALSSITKYEYDAKGNLTKTIDANANEIVMTYDLFGRKKTMDDPDMGHWEYDYDGFGNLDWQKDNKQSITEMQYDALNRLVKRTDADGGLNQQITDWTYDTANRTVQSIDANGNTQYTLRGPALGLLASVTTGSDYYRAHTYDQAGRPVKEVTTIKGAQFISERGYYRASKKIAWEKYPSGLVLSKEYDPSGYPKRLESGDLEKYQAYLTGYYAYEDLTYQVGQLEQAHRVELDHYIEQLKGEKTDETDADGNPIYAGGGLDDQVQPFVDAITTAVTYANHWQFYAHEAAQLYTAHAQWAQAYGTEFEWYKGEHDKNIIDPFCQYRWDTFLK